MAPARCYKTRHFAKHASQQRIVLEGPRDQLWLEPFRIDRRSVTIRAQEVARETEKMDVDDAVDEVISPDLVFLISQQKHSFTILHGDSLQRIPGRPPSKAHQMTRMIEPELLHGCFWSLNSIPYMGFVPVNPFRVCFGDALFSPVFLRKWELPLEQGDGQLWQLAPDLALQWQHLEDILVALRQMLVASLVIRGSQEHLPAPLPSYYRFSRPHPDSLLVTKRLVRARYAFLLLGAKISFLYALQCESTDFKLSFPDHLQRHFGHAPLVESILDSWLFWHGTGFFSNRYCQLQEEAAAKRTCPHQGMFVNVELCTLAHALRAYKNFHVPVWFWWGNRTRTHVPNSAIVARRYGYNGAMVAKYLVSVGASWGDLETGLLFERLVYKPCYEQRPRSKPVQILTDESLFDAAPNEQWFEFFQRRERTILAWPIKQDAQLFAIRQLSAQTHGFEQGSRVFEWLPSTKGTPSMLIRRRVPTHDAPRVWAEYKPFHRYYCAAYDEWDLTAALTADSPSSIALQWQENHILPLPIGESNNEDISTPLLSEVVRTSALSPVTITRHTELSVPAHGYSSRTPWEPAEDMDATPDREWMTPAVGSSPVTITPDYPDTSLDPQEDVQFAGPQGCELDERRLEDGEVSDTVNPKPRPIDWDPSYRALFPITQTPARLAIRRLECPSFATVLPGFYGMYVPPEFVRVPEDHQPSAIPYDTAKKYLKTCLRTLSCSRPSVNEELVYDGLAYHHLKMYFEHVEWYATALDATTISPHGPAMGWSDLMPSHASYVLRNMKDRLIIQRIQWRIRKEINYQFYWPNTLIRVLLYRATDVLWLLRRIHETSVDTALRELVTVGIRFTFATVALIPRSPELPASEEIPWRRYPFKATLADYEEYVARRARLFSYSCMLRAALLSGGIIWRIAMDHTSDPAGLLTTTPEEIQRIGSRAALPNGDVLANLSLTPHQKQIIIGAYHVSSGLPAPKDCATVSWFPSQVSFVKSGINVGFWSNDAESWYQLRVNSYIHSKKPPVATRSWPSTINLHSAANRFARGYEDRARTVLDAALA